MKFLGLIRANLFRKKIRFILTIGSFAVHCFFWRAGCGADGFQWWS